MYRLVIDKTTGEIMFSGNPPELDFMVDGEKILCKENGLLKFIINENIAIGMAIVDVQTLPQGFMCRKYIYNKGAIKINPNYIEPIADDAVWENSEEIRG